MCFGDFPFIGFKVLHFETMFGLVSLTERGRVDPHLVYYRPHETVKSV